MSATIRIAVYGDVDLNLIDGSAIWVQSIVDVAASASDTAVTLVLKAPVYERRLLEPLESRPSIRVVRPFEERMLPQLNRSLSPHQVAAILGLLDDDARFDVFVVRGQRVASRLADEARFQGRLWTYLTDIPQSASAMTSAAEEVLSRVIGASSLLLCQTEDLRTHLELMQPGAVGKAVLWPPVVADVPSSSPRASAGGSRRPLRLVYSGKMAKAWNTLEMTDLPNALHEAGVQAEVHIVGDKIHEEPSDLDFSTAMRAALGKPGVVWHGGVPRAVAMQIASDCEVGLSWRSPELDDSLEMSTKVLEFGALWRPVVVNKTPAHEALLGTDYPLFAASFDDVVNGVVAVANDDALYELAARRCAAAAEPHSRGGAVRRFTALVRRLRREPSTIDGRPRRIVVAGHDLKFIERLIAEWRRFESVEVRVDRWSALSEHDEQDSTELLEWADVVVCEWCGPNAIWYSTHKRPRTRLIVRLHRFELYSSYPRQLRLDAVDTIVTVNAHYQNLVREHLPTFPPERVIAVPNWVDCADLDRPKLAGAQFNLGMIGIAPRRKRLDRGVEVLSLVRRADPRFSLHVKSKLPWEYWWIWNDVAERAHYRDVFRQIEADRHVRGSVVFDPFGPDVASWLRQVGTVVSTSDDESFHLAPAEGMASGATAVIYPWPGAETVYGEDWIVDGPEDAARKILETADERVWRARSIQGQSEVGRYDLPAVTGRWMTLLLESNRS